jgi:hypothetical protein
MDGVVVNDGIRRAEDDDACNEIRFSFGLGSREKRDELTAVCGVDDGIVLYQTTCAAQADPVCPLVASLVPIPRAMAAMTAIAADSCTRAHLLERI